MTCGVVQCTFSAIQAGIQWIRRNIMPGKQFATCQSLRQAMDWWLDANGRATIERVKDTEGKWWYGLFEIGADTPTPDYL